MSQTNTNPDGIDEPEGEANTQRVPSQQGPKGTSSKHQGENEHRQRQVTGAKDERPDQPPAAPSFPLLARVSQIERARLSW